MTALVLLDEAEARKLTAEIKSYAGVLWQKLHQAHEGQAWRAMGYPSWSAYIAAEFDISRSRGYQLVSHAKAVQELAEAVGAEVSTFVDTLTEGQTRNLDVPAAAAAIADRAAELPEDATDEDRAALVADEVERQRTATITETRTETTTTTVDAETGEIVPPRDPAPVPPPPQGAGSPNPTVHVDPAVVLRQRASAAVVKARDLLDLDPSSVASALLPEDVHAYTRLAHEVAEWAVALDDALTNRTRTDLRIVQ